MKMMICPTVAVLLLLQLLKCSSVAIDDFPCPNGTSTCSATAGGVGGGCCPYVGGTCCTDGLNCCPATEVCYTERALCVSKMTRPWKLPQTSTTQLHSMVPLLRGDWSIARGCDAAMSCPASAIVPTTCCPSPYIGYDCCPLSDGVCCGDFLHCCPANTSCDLIKGLCISQKNSYHGTPGALIINSVPYYRKTKALQQSALKIKHVDEVDNIKCLDNVTVCYDSDTCCSIGGGSYGCCPIPNAVCCSDYKNCCPSGMTCDPRTGSCIRQNGELFRGLPLLSSVASSLVHKSPAVIPFRVAEKSTANMKSFYKSLIKPGLNVICPGGQYSCPDWMTCCLSGGLDTPKTKYSCCPFPNAVCCSDDKHCCPQGTKCDLTHDVCVDSVDGKFTALTAKLSLKKVAKVTVAGPMKIVCPDQETCPDMSTCCQLASGRYGCCPSPQAVCCSDHVHCCPHGYVCDIRAGGCRQGNSVNLHPFGEINQLTSSDNGD